MKDALRAADEYMSHLSTTATCDNEEFRLVNVWHLVELESVWHVVQTFWPLDLDRIRVDMHISIQEPTIRQRITADYLPPVASTFHYCRDLVMADGTKLRAEYCAYDRIYTTDHKIATWPCEARPTVTADAIEALIQKGDLGSLRNTIKTAHLNMLGTNSNRPIHMAIEHDQPHILEWLLTQPGIDVNRTPYMCSNIAFLLPMAMEDDLQRTRIRYLCVLIRAGMLPICDKSNVFQYLVYFHRYAIRHLFRKSDVIARLMEYAIYTFDRLSHGALPVDICRGPEGSAQLLEFFVRASDAVRSLIIAHVPVDSLVDVIIAYISGPGGIQQEAEGPGADAAGAVGDEDSSHWFSQHSFNDRMLDGEPSHI